MRKLHTAQVAWFHSANIQPEAANVFEGILRTEPESIQRHRSVTAMNPYLSVAEGVIDTVKWVVQVQPGRLDVHCFSAIDELELGAQIPSIEFLPVKDIAAKVGDFLSEEIESVYRVAFAPTFIEPGDSYEICASRFFHFINAPFSDDGATDLTFQINKRKILEGGSTINRLIRLQILAMQAMAIGPDGRQFLVENSKVANTVMVDINTLPESTFLDPSKQRLIFANILDEAQGFAECTNPIERVLE